MAIPSYEKFLLPVLKLLSDGKVRTKQEIVRTMAKQFQLSEDELAETLPSQTQLTYVNRIGWAITYLKKAELIVSPSRANFKITDEGKKLVENNVSDLTAKDLKQYEPFLKFIKTSHKQNDTDHTIQEETTPLENMINNFELLKKEVCDEILQKILEQSPDFFEQLVVDLVVAMGYGGSIEDAGKATKRTGDEGIDGIIKQDRLGLDNIYLQAKRWQRDNVVSRPEIQKFVGALAGQGARKGIFITTSRFSKDALEYKPRNDTSVILIDGQKLVELMYEYNIGVTTEMKFEIKRLDSDYFDLF